MLKWTDALKAPKIGLAAPKFYHDSQWLSTEKIAFGVEFIFAYRAFFSCTNPKNVYIHLIGRGWAPPDKKEIKS